MKKYLLIVFIIFIVAASAGLFYLNNVFLPRGIKALVAESLEEATQKKVILGAVGFNIFKGLVLRDLIIYDNNVAILNSKEISASVLILPVFKKHILVPSIKITAPEIFIERRTDNSINILDPFRRDLRLRLKHDFSISIHKITISDGHVIFHDNMLNPALIKNFRNVNLEVTLTLPAKARFRLQCETESSEPLRIYSAGEYVIPNKEFSATFDLKGFSFGEIGRYYSGTLVSLPDGKLDALAEIKYKNGVIDLSVDAKTGMLRVTFDRIKAEAASVARANLRYNIADKRLSYFGNLDIEDMSLSGIPDIDRVDKIKGNVVFSDSAISSDSLNATVAGLPVNAKIKITDLKEASPVMNIDIVSDLALDTLQRVLKENFRITLPAEFGGSSKIDVALQYKIPFTEAPHVKGALKMFGATIYTNDAKPLIRDINGSIKFTPNQIEWSNLDFIYLDTAYRASGTLTNFNAPGVQMELHSKDLSLKSIFAINDKLFTFSRLSGKYHDSEFSVNGSMDITDPSGPKTDIKGALDTDLEDLKQFFGKLRDESNKIKPAGKVRAEFSLKGNIRDIRACAIDAKLSSASLSLYGFKLSDFSASYMQADGVGDILSSRSFLYGGIMDLSGKLNLKPEKFSYSLNAEVKGVKLEQFKKDTAFKDKDIAGIVNMKGRISGVSDELSKLEGFGSLGITGGKLWQLNLFQGLGALLFSSDFSNIIFSDGYCNFLIKDSSVYTDDLRLKSDVINMNGSVRIGFDNSINASLKAQVKEEAIEASNAVKRITNAIGRYSIIGVTGTLKDPKYSMKADVGDIMEDLASAIFR